MTHTVVLLGIRSSLLNQWRHVLILYDTLVGHVTQIPEESLAVF